MTRDEKLQIITDQIRKDIPRLMELSIGSVITRKDIATKNKIINKIGKLYYISNGLLIEEIDESIIQKYYNVIGLEPQLNDVLEWIEKNHFFTDDLYIDNDGFLGLLDYCFDKFKVFKIQWDLSKPYLKDQSAELIDFLFNLKN